MLTTTTIIDMKKKNITESDNNSFTLRAIDSHLLPHDKIQRLCDLEAENK